ncbi:YlbF family regulator [Fictibacillus iocasae]|uniref:YlbF family regulator n=1 Tax=Fictibacillus iocasae TaxID=2715437 RepID=A0ABW2NNK1_9BACL
MRETVSQLSILEETSGLASMVAQSEAASAYRYWKNELESDSEAQSLIKRFQYMKEQFEEVQRFGKYHPDYAAVNKSVREMKRDLDFHSTISAFKKAEKELDKLLIECSQIIAESVSPSIKVPTGNPFLDSKSCSGGCGSGGSCGCG